MENSYGRHGSETIGQLAASQKSTRDNKGEGLGGGLGALAQRLSCDYLLEAEGEPQQILSSRQGRGRDLPATRRGAGG